MKVILYVCLLFTFLFLSCTGKKDNGVLTFKLSKSDYIEKISVTGTVQAVVNFPVTPPSMRASTRRASRFSWPANSVPVNRAVVSGVMMLQAE